MAICSVDFNAWLSCKGQNNKKTQSLLQDKKSTADYPYTWLDLFFETSKCEQVREVVLRTLMPPCCPIVAPEKQVLHHGTGHSSSPATTCAIGHNVAHFLETHGDSPPLLIRRNSLKAHPFMKHYATPNIHKKKTYWHTSVHYTRPSLSTLTFRIQSCRLYPSGCGERMHHDQPF